MTRSTTARNVRATAKVTVRATAAAGRSTTAKATEIKRTPAISLETIRETVKARAIAKERATKAMALRAGTTRKTTSLRASVSDGDGKRSKCDEYRVNVARDGPAIAAALRLGGDLAEVFRIARPHLAFRATVRGLPIPPRFFPPSLIPTSQVGGSSLEPELELPATVEQATRKSLAAWTSILVRSVKDERKAKERAATAAVTETGSADSGCALPRPRKGRAAQRRDVAQRCEVARPSRQFHESLLRPATAPLERPRASAPTPRRRKLAAHAFRASPAPIATLDLGCSGSSDDDVTVCGGGGCEDYEDDAQNFADALLARLRRSLLFLFNPRENSADA